MTTSLQRVRLGVLGAGNVAESFHLPVLSSVRGVDIRWLCDKDIRRARALASIAGIPHFADTLDDCGDVDVVLVAIPVGERRAALQKVLARGWDAFCEKPFAATLRDHEWIVAEARRRDVRLGIGLVRRYYPSTQVARDVLDANILGPLRLVVASEGSRVRQTGRSADWYQACAPASGGGFLAEAGSHLIDQVFTICRAFDYEINNCNQKTLSGLEFETRVDGCLYVDGERRAPFEITVSRLRDVYNGLVLRCENGEFRLGTTANGVVEFYHGNEGIGGQPRLVEDDRTAFLTAIRTQWERFIRQRDRPSASGDGDTGLLTTAFVEDCYRFTDSLREPRLAARAT